MRLRDRIGNILQAAGLVTVPRARAMPTGAVGQPSYAGRMMTVLPRAMSFTLLGQFYKNIPALKRAVAILSGYVGTPRFALDSEAATDAMNEWADTVAYGHIGRGVAPWLKDHLAQSLIYGYGVGEAVAAPTRQDIERLWNYLSPSCGFRSAPDGSLEVLQAQAFSIQQALNPETVLVSVHDPAASNPNGESLFWSIPSVCQLWMDILNAHRSTWRRTGIPVFHINWEPPETFNDPDGSGISASVLADLETGFNEGIRSQVQDGLAKDFYTSGKISVTTIGADGQAMDIQVSKRAIVEEILVATGIPPWLFGYTWSTTERLSQQQADMLLATVESLRREVSGTLHKLGTLRMRLAGVRGELGVEWPDVNLQDATETARAELMVAQAESTREKTSKELWRNGVYDQLGYAEHVTGSPDVATPMDEPAAAPAPAAPPGSPPAAADVARAAQREALAEYPDLWQRHADCCGAKLMADDPANLFPSEEPQYPELRQDLQRTWSAVADAFGTLRRRMFAAAGLEEPAKAAKARLSADERRRLDIAIEQFMRSMAGEQRDRAGFTSSQTEDGLLQQMEFLGYQVGMHRGLQVAPNPQNPEFTEAIRRNLMDSCFERLTQDGQWRFELRLEEIRDELVDALARGDSPLAVAREFAADLDGYERGRLRTICRTEMGIASEAGIRDTFRASGIRRVEVLGDPTTDAACTVHIGQVYDLSDEDNLPIYHPNCYCSIVAVTEETSE